MSEKSAVEIVRERIKFGKRWCSQGYKGCCCCNCANQVQIMKHPWNKGEAKGSIMERMGYGCAAEFEDGSNAGKVIFSDNQHGMCELWDKDKAI